jgi:hypothetical protein
MSDNRWWDMVSPIMNSAEFSLKSAECAIANTIFLECLFKPGDIDLKNPDMSKLMNYKGSPDIAKLIRSIVYLYLNSDIENFRQWLMTELDSAEMSDNVIAVEFIKKSGVSREHYKGSLQKYDSQYVEKTQEIVNQLSLSFGFGSDYAVAFKTHLILVALSEYQVILEKMQNR